MENFSIVTASHKEDVLAGNLMASKITRTNVVEVCRGFTNVPEAYNSIVPTEITMYVHNDVFVPNDFEEQIKQAIKHLPSTWAVLGVAGVNYSMKNRTYVGHINDRGRVWGKPISSPIPVQTLDELLLVVNHKHDLKFDEQFPLDMYGADICMQAHAKGLGVYCIPGYVHHNSSRKVGERTPAFYEAKKLFENKWRDQLPVATTCTLCLPQS